jgi:glycosyltransferase involved in cell wall biosynthesis
VRLQVGYQVDESYSLAQHSPVREVLARLDPDRFHVTAFYDREPDRRLVARPNTRLIRLPSHLKTVVRLWHLMFDHFDRCVYLAPEPSSFLYLHLKPRSNRAVTSVEGQVWSGAFASAGPAARRYAFALIRLSARITAVTEEVAEGVLEHFGRGAAVVPIGVDTDVFRPGPPRSGSARPRVLFVGALQPWKRPHLVLVAAERFPEADFLLLGQGPLLEELQILVRSKRLANVEIRPPISHSELAAKYRDADVFLFPSASEGLPKVLLEASASGLPSIVHGNYRPVAVEHEHSGLVVRSEEDMLSAVALLLADAPRRAAMGAAAREMVARFSWDAVAKRWAEVLAEPLPRQ